MRTTLTILGAVAAMTSPARAAWQGDITVTTPGKSEMHGTIYGRVGAMRMDIEMGQGPKMSTLVKNKEHKAYILMHAMKKYMEMPLDSTRHGVVCEDADTEQCLIRKGFTKTGSERVNGHPCAIYEADPKDSKTPKHVKVWHPTDLKEVVMVKSVTTDPSGKSVEMNITGLKTASLSDDLFQVPADYTPSAARK